MEKPEKNFQVKSPHNTNYENRNGTQGVLLIGEAEKFYHSFK